MAVAAQAFEIARLVVAALGLGDDVVNCVVVGLQAKRCQSSVTIAGLAQIHVALEYRQAQLGPCCSVSTVMA